MESIAPGMERIVAAGDTLVIEDQQGQQFAVTGREADETMEFLKEFDRWFTLIGQNIKGPVVDAQWYAVKEAFNALPVRLQRELPSFAAGGVLVKEHQH